MVDGQQQDTRSATLTLFAVNAFRDDMFLRFERSQKNTKLAEIENFQNFRHFLFNFNFLGANYYLCKQKNDDCSKAELCGFSKKRSKTSNNAWNNAVKRET